MTETARSRAYHWTRQAILDGRFPEGSFLEEKTLCEETGVSRTPVREALQQLAGDGYLDLLPRRGAQVRRVTARDLIETYEMRSLLEIHGFELVCAKQVVLPDSVEALLTELECPDRIAAIKSGDRLAVAAHAQLDFSFHVALVEAAGNNVLTELFRQLQPRTQRIAATAITARPSRVDLIGVQHRAIHESLQSHDLDSVSAALRKHLSPDEQVVALLR